MVAEISDNLIAIPGVVPCRNENRPGKICKHRLNLHVSAEIIPSHNSKQAFIVFLYVPSGIVFLLFFVSFFFFVCVLLHFSFYNVPDVPETVNPCHAE